MSEEQNTKRIADLETRSVLPLAIPERTVMLRMGERKLLHVFAPLTAEDWLEYDRMTRPTMRPQKDESLETDNSMLEASDALWRKRIVRVEGYPESFAARWRDLMPLGHRVLTINALGQVQAADDQDVLPDSESVIVRLEAWWNGVFFGDLRHHFQRPLVEHELKFHGAARRSAIVTHKVGGQRRPTAPQSAIVSLPQLPTLLKLYDELIEAVEGYAPADPKKMDAMHKSAAVRGLFMSRTAELELPTVEGGDDAGA
ncbi:MAG: hypothetical protein WC485_00995 [Opitutaceae bacterium]